MNTDTLPKGSAPEPVKFPHFPSRQQAFIWKNWEMVPVEKIAEVLSASPIDINEAAKEMGLQVPPEVNTEWLSKGYQTIIRNNWHILNYEQLLQLLDWDSEKLAYTLKEEDFLWVKLGYLKPACEPLKFKELSKAEKNKTIELRKSIEKHFSVPLQGYNEKPFAFMSNFAPAEATSSESKFDFNFLHPFSAPYGDIFLDSDTEIISDNLLSQYANLGIKGIWLQAILYTLHPITGAETISKGYETRLENLNKLVDKCARHGISVYLYLNEPRCMPKEFYQNFPHWKGASIEDAIAPCVCTTQSKEPIQWLGDACFNVFKKVPKLGGAFMITMSENETHCHSRFYGEKCPFCKERPVADIVSEILCTIEKSIHSASPEAKVIAWDWAWRDSEKAASNLELELDIIKRLPEKIIFMRVSERAKKTYSGGIANEVMDYSISQVGPSEASVKLWEAARKRGLKTAAKVQLNNTWELSAVPYLPVPFLIKEHLDNLSKNNVEGLMLSWSLGGYPGGNLELINKIPERLAKDKFGAAAAPLICKAWRAFGEALREFPFDIKVIYDAPMNFGPMNLLHLKTTGYRSTMIGFPYDDLEGWRACYPEDIFEKQFQILSKGWLTGLEILHKAQVDIPENLTKNYKELETIAKASFCHFRSTYLQIKFIRLRNSKNIKAMQEVLEEEIILAKELLQIVQKDSRIGFEASNHYFYSLNDLREKVINCEYLIAQLINI